MAAHAHAFDFRDGCLCGVTAEQACSREQGVDLVPRPLQFPIIPAKPAPEPSIVLDEKAERVWVSGSWWTKAQIEAAQQILGGR